MVTHRFRSRALLCLAFGLALGLAPPSNAQAPRTWTVYSSLPMDGGQRFESVATMRGIQLALSEAGGMAGSYRLRYVPLNDATSFARTWTPERTVANAQRAARDRSTIGYIGELNSGASAISIPILNEVGVPQVSPANEAIGLTRGGPGSDRGEPIKYYVTGKRTFFRLATTDRVQGGALASAMRDRGCKRIVSLTDGEVYGSAVGHWLRHYSREVGLRVVGSGRINPKARSYRALAERLRRRRPTCVAFTGITANGAVPLFETLARVMPGARLFGSNGIAESDFSMPRRGGISRRVARRVLVTIPVRALSAYPPAAQAMLGRYQARFGALPSSPYVFHGYEAMRLLLDAVAAVGPDRAEIIRWLEDVRGRDSVLGQYSFDRFHDATIREYGVYRIRFGGFLWAGTAVAPR